MKTAILVSLSFFVLQGWATVDALTTGWIVTQNVQDADDFQIVQVPIIGCYGLSQGPQLTQFTAEHNIKESMGCGDSSTRVMNINALTCASVDDSEESADHMSFRKITLNVSRCSYKNNAKFITMVRTAAARNFPQTKNGHPDNTRQVDLIIVK